MKKYADQNIEQVLKNAELNMYKDKIINKKTLSENYINTIIEALHSNNPYEKEHSFNVSKLCKDIGNALKLSETEVKKLKDAGFLHDIGKVALYKDNHINEDNIPEENKNELKV